MSNDSLQSRNSPQFSSSGTERRRAKFAGTALRAAGSICVLLILSSPALATIETIKGSLTCFIGCNRSVVQMIAQGENHAFEVVGQLVDTSTAVEITGSGVSVSYGTRKHGAGSSIIVNFVVGDNATPGERTVRMRYAIETSGPDTFTVRVVPKGTVTQIQYQRRLPFQPGGAATELVAPTGMPLNERVLLIVTGTKLQNAEVRPETTYSSVRVLPGATDTRMVVEIEFTSAGQGVLSIFDSNLSAQDMRSSTSSKFSYTGNRNISYGGNQSSGSTFIQPVLSGGGGGGGGTFVDVAPRANMINVFRRTSTNPAFTENGVQYFPIDSQHCNGVLAGQSRVITIPNPRWGVSNVGTAAVATPFTVELRSGAALLDTQNVTSLSPGQTRDFDFARQNSRVRVFTFLTRGGCFVSTTASDFFEDPPFTVKVDINNALPETAINRNNNNRNY